MPNSLSSTPGNNESSADESGTPHEQQDDLNDFTQEELSLFIIFLLKSRITILETV